MVACIKAAADDVATDTADDRFDDSNGRGFLRYRRARNRMIEEFDGDGAVVAESANNALSVNTDGVAISFYSMGISAIAERRRGCMPRKPVRWT